MTFETERLSRLLRDEVLQYGIVQPGREVSDGVPIVRVKDIFNGQLNLLDPARVDPEVSRKHRRTVLNGGELLITLVGSVGNTAIAPLEVAGWNVARAIGVIRPVPGVEAQWLKMCFETEFVKAQIVSRLNTTVQATLNLADLKAVQVPFPDPARRSAITAVISALDDKIVSNRILTETADSLSLAHFSSMPKNKEVPLSALARFINGRAFTKDASGSGRVVVRIAELNSGLGGSTVYSDRDVANDYLVRSGDLLFAWSGSLTVHRWYRHEAIVNQHIFKVVPRDHYPMWLVHQALAARLEEFKAIASGKATTMGHIQRRHLDEVVAIPAPETVTHVDALMSDLWRTALAAEVENLALIELKDTLLPALMSGRLSVTDAKRHVEDAV